MMPTVKGEGVTKSGKILKMVPGCMAVGMGNVCSLSCNF